MTSDRWNPIRDVMTLREAMDRLLEDSFVRPPSGRPGNFPVDLIEREDSFQLRASIPGVNPDQLHVTVQGDTLTITGQVQEDDSAKGTRFIIRERQAGMLKRALPLPAPVAADRAEAQFEHGVLTLTLPKMQSSAPHQIRIGQNRSAPAGPAGEGTTAQAGQVSSAGNPSVVDPTQVHGQAAKQGTEMAQDVPSKDPVTVESEESFPASDPPSWTPERA